MFTIPDKGEGAADVQSLLFQDELERAINDPLLGTFVKSGLAVTAQGTPNLTVAVAAGVVYSQGSRFPIAAVASLAISVADLTNPRLDTVVVTSAGVVAIRAGTPVAYNIGAGTTPKPPNLTLGDVSLAQIYVPAADLAVQAADIIDRRIFVPNLTNLMVEVGTVENLCHILPASGSTAPNLRGIAGLINGGTISHPALAITNRYTQTWRQRFANVVTTTNQILGYYFNNTILKQFWRGNAAGLGGFYFRGKMWIGLWPGPTVRLFMGLNSSPTPSTTADALAGDQCGVWHDTTMAATVLNFIVRDGTTVNTIPITLATAMAAGQGYELVMYCLPNGTNLYYKVVDMLTGLTLIDSVVSTNLPRNTILLGPEMAMSNGTANITVATVAPEITECLVTSPAVRG